MYPHTIMVSVLQLCVEVSLCVCVHVYVHEGGWEESLVQ